MGPTFVGESLKARLADHKAAELCDVFDDSSGQIG